MCSLTLTNRLFTLGVTYSQSLCCVYFLWVTPSVTNKQQKSIPLLTWVWIRRGGGGVSDLDSSSSVTVGLCDRLSSNACFEFQLQKIKQFPLLLAQMSVVKSKLRNQMSLKSLNSILYIWYGLKLSAEACYDHQLPDNVDDPLFLWASTACVCVWRDVWKKPQQQQLAWIRTSCHHFFT